MFATVPTDAAQFFAHIIRILQKLAFLYGWQEFFRDEQEGLDDETANKITLFIGIMFGVNAANMAIGKIASVAAEGIPKHLMRQALTQGTIYPIIKNIAKKIGVQMTKATFTKAIGKIIPVVGAVVSGGFTFAIFKPMANKLKKHLETLPTADINFYKEQRDGDIIIDIDFSDIDLTDMEDAEIELTEEI